MRLTERIAKAVIEANLPGAQMRFRMEQANGEYDFDLVLPDGTIAALEVTTAANEEELRTWEALRNGPSGGPFVHAELCKLGWYVHPRQGARIKTIRKHVDAYLEPIERAGFVAFDVDLHSATNRDVQRIGKDLRLDRGEVIHWTKPNLIGIATPGRGGVVNRDDIGAALYEEVWKLDNVKKLARALCAERHFFLVVDPTSQDAWGAMQYAEMPSRQVHLPDGITKCWIAASIGDLRSVRTLTFSRTDGWSDLGWSVIGNRI